MLVKRISKQTLSMIRYTQWAFDRKNGVGSYRLAVVDERRSIDTDQISGPLMGALTFQNNYSVTRCLTR